MVRRTSIQKAVLSGNEAIARGAWEAGVTVASAYPGTPSTEIVAALAQFPGVYAEWATNEKVALDVAIGAAYSGRRALSALKCVGLNVASDALFYASVTGVEGGLVIVSADDPGLHSSQDEQDNRQYARFARIPVLEPSDSQEAKEIVGAALDLGERFETPTLIRLTTRLAHGYSVVRLGPRREPQRVPLFPRDPQRYVVLFDREQRYPRMAERLARIAACLEDSPWNRLEAGDSALGIITCGVAYQYAREVFPEASFLKLGITYPLPAGLVGRFAHSVERLLVLEELDPFVEEQVRLLGIPVEGKSLFPSCGELSPERVHDCAVRAGLRPSRQRPQPVPNLPPRPPTLCAGCPHRAFFYLARRLNLLVHGDIGCYTLGALPPLQAMHSCGCMSASIGVAHGACKAGSLEKHVAVLGDSTFLHSGLPALLNLVHNHSDVVVVILDNGTTAMTGQQDTVAGERTLQDRPAPALDLAAIARALGVERATTVDAYDLCAIETELKRCLDSHGPTVLVIRGPCVQCPDWVATQTCWIDPERCVGCHTCLRLGCPAMLPTGEVAERTGRRQTWIDPLACTGCTLCAQICSRESIRILPSETQ
ncbi:MAG: indolepyruvate ferredoxin oxidoreductase subunit alpha [Chloroflexia bacterium]|nr:indolepyruvate ferredoxin oxidoreductase subunit alpha [Chloroflexia bacterium]